MPNAGIALNPSRSLARLLLVFRYVRQYHNLRPYIQVNRIPNFDPTMLPFWKLYTEESSDSYNPNILIGGTMAGQFTAGLSGGQRKLLLFELIKQRTCKEGSKDLLIALDEPFAGVTDGASVRMGGYLKVV